MYAGNANARFYSPLGMGAITKDEQTSLLVTAESVFSVLGDAAQAVRVGEGYGVLVPEAQATIRMLQGEFQSLVGSINDLSAEDMASTISSLESIHVRAQQLRDAQSRRNESHVGSAPARTLSWALLVGGGILVASWAVYKYGEK